MYNSFPKDTCEFAQELRDVSGLLWRRMQERRRAGRRRRRRRRRFAGGEAQAERRRCGVANYSRPVTFLSAGSAVNSLAMSRVSSWWSRPGCLARYLSRFSFTNRNSADTGCCGRPAPADCQRDYCQPPHELTHQLANRPASPRPSKALPCLAQLHHTSSAPSCLAQQVSLCKQRPPHLAKHRLSHPASTTRITLQAPPISPVSPGKPRPVSPCKPR